MVLKRDSDKFTRPIDRPESRREKWERIARRIDRISLRDLFQINKWPTWSVIPFILFVFFFIWITAPSYEMHPVSVSVAVDLRQTELVQYSATFKSTSSGRVEQEAFMASFPGHPSSAHGVSNCMAIDGGRCEPVGFFQGTDAIEIVPWKSELPSGQWSREVRLAPSKAASCDLVTGICKARFPLSTSPGRDIQELSGRILFPKGTFSDSIKIAFSGADLSAVGQTQGKVSGGSKMNPQFNGLTKVDLRMVADLSGLQANFVAALSAVPSNERNLFTFIVEWTVPVSP